MNNSRIIMPSDGKISNIGPNAQMDIPTLGIPIYPDCMIFYALCVRAQENPELLQVEARERLQAIVSGFPMVFEKFGYSVKDFMQFYKKEEKVIEDKNAVPQTEEELRGDKEQKA